MLLAAIGLRATEALSIRLKDFDISSEPAKLIIRGEYTKTKVDRYVFMTREINQQIKTWINYKYRKRRICYKDKETGENITEYRIPEKKPNELIFSMYQTDI
jgi:integrase